MMHIVELAACMAPTRDLDQRRLAVGRGRAIEPIESGVAVGMQESQAGAEQPAVLNAGESHTEV
jgi:hypothetical protein